MCPRCQGERWTCEQHPDRPWPHDDCPGPGEPCSARNVSDPPDKPPDFVSYVNASDPFYTPGSIPPATKARPAGPLWTIRRGDHTIACELRYHGEYGVEVQTLRDGELFSGRRFDTRAQAVQWAELEREAWSAQSTARVRI